MPVVFKNRGEYVAHANICCFSGSYQLTNAVVDAGVPIDCRVHRQPRIRLSNGRKPPRMSTLILPNGDMVINVPDGDFEEVLS